MRGNTITWLTAAALALVTTVSATQVSASVQRIEHGNSWAWIWPSQGAYEEEYGMTIWTVEQHDGTDLNILHRQWFWYRIDRPVGVEGEKPLHALDPDPFVFASDTNGDGTDDNLRVRYDGADDGLTIEVNYNLMGGTPGSGRADMAETIGIINQANVAQTVHFFQYSDFNMSFNEDRTAILWPNTAAVCFSDIRMSETVVTPVPTAHEVGLATDLLDSLNDDLPTTLNGFSGPLWGDTAWAFQWDMTLEAGGSLLISKDKSITPTPEPATLALLAAGAVGLMARRRRKYT